MALLRRSLLPAVVFLTGGAVLVVEVLAVRVLSPYYGNTIFTVSSVISVILLALSCGYYVGGRLADRHPSLQWFFGIILASGVLHLLLYGLGSVILLPLSGTLSLATGPLVSSALLFLLPALLLGTVSPYAVKLQSLYAPEQGVGSVAGAIFFWSTLGSITGSLLAGFVLIPTFGIDRILLATGALLVAVGLVPLLFVGGRSTRLSALAVAVGALGTSAALPFGADAWPSDVARERVEYSKDGVYQKITIYEDTYDGRPARILLLDRSESGAMFLDSSDPTDLVYDYTKYYSLYKIFTPRVRNALVLGGGSYSIPKALLQELPDAIVDVAEIEPWLFDLAKEYFGAVDSPRLRNYVQDGRRFLRDSDTQYDLIFGDVYYSYFSVPPQFTTREFFALAEEKLQPGGVFIANMIGDVSRKLPSLVMAEIKTFQSVFPNSYFFAVDAPEKIDLVQNITFVGYKSDAVVDVNVPPVTTHPDLLIRFLRYKVLDVARRFELSPYPILTDDFSPVEYLTARVLQRSLGGLTTVDGNEMRAVVDQQSRYGSRDAGVAGHAKLRDFLRAELGGLTQEVIAQAWKESRPDGTTDELTNLVGRLFASQSRRAVVAAPYGGANTSGPAVLLELARNLISTPVVPRVGVDIVLFDDGVWESGQDADRADQGPPGPRDFVAHLDELYGSTPPVAAVVLGPVCGRDVTIVTDPSSMSDAPAFGIPLGQAGIPTAFVADAEYLRSRTPGDRLDGCRPESLEVAARAVLTYLNDLE